MPPRPHEEVLAFVATEVVPWIGFPPRDETDEGLEIGREGSRAPPRPELEAVSLELDGDPGCTSLDRALDDELPGESAPADV